MLNSYWDEAGYGDVTLVAEKNLEMTLRQAVRAIRIATTANKAVDDLCERFKIDCEVPASTLKELGIQPTSTDKVLRLKR